MRGPIRGIVPLLGRISDHDQLLQLIGDSRLVLIGASTHGTREFYRLRVAITKRLLTERGFNAVCIEGEWPAAERVNQYVRGSSTEVDAATALDGFRQFPNWLWRNTEVVEFVHWLRQHNDRCGVHGQPKAGFYGLDLFSFTASIEAVIRSLHEIDPVFAVRARKRYQTPTRDNVLAELVEIQRQAARFEGRDAVPLPYFSAEQNARVVANAEQYFSSAHENATVAWNLREMHMHYTLERLSRHLAARDGSARVVAWLHNAHAGNAQATSLVQAGRLTVGGLLRRRYGTAVILVALMTYKGSVTAAADWHLPGEPTKLRPARPDSFEYGCHAIEEPRFFLPLRGLTNDDGAFPLTAHQRLVGVVYSRAGEAERPLLFARVPEQFDALYFVDSSHAVEALETGVTWDDGDPPPTYPTGL